MSSRSWMYRIAILAVVGLAAVESRQTEAFSHFTVDRLDDVADATACTSGPDDCSLRGAVIAANASAGYDQISVPEAVYTLTIAGADEDGALTGDLDVTDPVKIDGAGELGTVIDANELDRVFSVRLGGSEGAFRLQDMTLRNGEGGGAGLDVANSIAEIGDVTMLGGDATGSGGGGVYAQALSTVTLRRVTITKNTADAGGALFVQGPGTEVDVFDSELNGNNAVVYGGGIYKYLDGVRLLVERSTIVGNTAQFGGGIFAGVGASSLTVANSTVSGNAADGAGAQGGALYMERLLTLAPSSNVEVPSVGFVYATIADNTAPAGQGAIDAYFNQPYFAGSIVDNPGANCSAADNSSGGGNVFSDGSCASPQSSDLASVDPLLGILTDNGGPTLTHLPANGSPAIDRAGLADAVCYRGTYDQRNIRRWAGTTCDAGAIEADVPVTSERRWGDTDCSGVVTPGDASLILLEIVETENVFYEQGGDCPRADQAVYLEGFSAANLWFDVDCDRQAAERDALRVLRFLAGLPIPGLDPCPGVDDEVETGITIPPPSPL